MLIFHSYVNVYQRVLYKHVEMVDFPYLCQVHVSIFEGTQNIWHNPIWDDPLNLSVLISETCVHDDVWSLELIKVYIITLYIYIYIHPKLSKHTHIYIYIMIWYMMTMKKMMMKMAVGSRSLERTLRRSFWAKNIIKCPWLLLSL